MSDWHRIGQLVACIDPWEWFVCDPRRLPGLYERDVYTIADVKREPAAEVSPVLFKMAEHGPGIGWYPAQRFRPVKDTSIASLKLKEPA